MLGPIFMDDNDEILQSLGAIERALADLAVVAARILRLQEKIALGLGVSLAEE